MISPLLSNLYLNEVDKMLERAREVTRNGKYTYVEYAEFADDLVVLIDAHKRHDWLIGGGGLNGYGRSSASSRLKSMMKRAAQSTWNRGESFGFLEFDFRYLRSLRGAMWPHYAPKLKKRTALMRKLKEALKTDTSSNRLRRVDKA